MPSLTTTLRRSVLFGRRLAATLKTRVAGNAAEGRGLEVSSTEFRATIDSTLAGLPADALAAHALLRIPADQAPWFETGIDLQAGDEVTWVANGYVHLSKLLDIYVEPHFQLWARVGDGDVFRGVRATHTFKATESGRLELASYFPGEWSSSDGSFSMPASAWAGMQGGMDVAVFKWAGDAEPRIRALADAGHDWANAEIARVEDATPAPPGWNYRR